MNTVLHLRENQGEIIRMRDKLLEDHSKLRLNAIVNDMTGAFNRGHFLQCLKVEFARSVRHNRALSLIIMDINQLKEINKRYGYAAGDFILKEEVNILRRFLRVHDILGHYEGDKLGIILPETNEKGAQRVAEKIHSLIQEHTFSYPPADKIQNTVPQAIVLQVSLGLASYPHPNIQNADNLLESAHKSLTQVKETKPEKYSFFSAAGVTGTPPPR